MGCLRSFNIYLEVSSALRYKFRSQQKQHLNSQPQAFYPAGSLSLEIPSPSLRGYLKDYCWYTHVHISVAFLPINFFAFRPELAYVSLAF